LSVRVKVFTDGDRYKDGCVYYRTYLPAQTLMDQGHDNVTHHRTTDNVLWQDDITYSGYKIPRVKGWHNPECDVAVFQRPLLRDVADLIEWCSRNGVKTVVDMDDDFMKIPRANKAWENVQPDQSPIRNTDHLKRAIAACDLVTTTTPALARRYAPRKSVILPNYASSSWLNMPARPMPDVASLGWTGTMHTHPHDLESTRGALGKVLKDTRSRLHIVGDGEGVEEALQLDSATEVTKTGWVPLPHYHVKTNDIDVGVVPLHASAFNQGKSWLKGLEFATLGIPFVASNTQPYVQLHNDHGIGLIARNPREWYDLTKRLLTDMNYREDMGERWRDIVRDRMTIEHHAHRWLEAWESVAARRLVGV
jgi:glycosyltransferase involved in cell wall biosynthesis